MAEQQRLEAMRQPESHQGTGDVSFPWIVAALLRGRRTIFVVVAVGFFLSLGMALLRPTFFTSSFSFVPQSGQDRTRSGLASIAGQFGIPVGALGSQSEPPQLYADLLLTREILGDIARDSVTVAPRQHAPLAAFLGVKGSGPVADENTMRVLKQRVIAASVAARTTGMVTVTVRTQSPDASYEIAQRLIDGLNRFNVSSRKSQATEERRFTESRLNEAQASLRAAEDALQSFLQANRQVGSFSEANFQRERLQSKVTLQQSIVTGLAQQYEDARIREVRDTPVITMIERPVLPAIPDPRGRGLAVAMGVVGSIFLAVTFVLVREGWTRQRTNELDSASYDTLAGEWRSFRDQSRKV